jgi:twitching motility protein PilT
MARIDPLIEKLLAGPAQALVFETGKGASLLGTAGPQRLVQQPLTASQIAGAFAEIVPAELRSGFPRAGATTFPYLSPYGAVDVQFESRDGAARATVRPRPADEGLLEPDAADDLLQALEAPAPVRLAAPPRAAPARNGAPAPAAPSQPAAGPLPSDPRAGMNALLDMMLDRRASDLHLSTDCPPALRVDGDMTPLVELGPLGHERTKEMLWSIAPEKNREEWHARRDTDFAHETARARFRVNAFADRKGIGAVLRQIPSEILTAEDMGLSQAMLDLCLLPKGLVLVTGPTGSGKSTTLAALIDYVNRTRSDHIITIEDPIEFVHSNKKCLVNQREVGTHTQSFKAALRAALREDPDIVLVGEMRDLETIAIAIETAETGHLVFGTLHTNTAASTVDRIIDQFPADRQAQIRMMLSDSLKGVISQTLCKKVGGGRVAAQEVLLCTASIANLIREGKTYQIPSIMQTARGQGMVTLNDALLDLVRRRVVEPREAYLKAVSKGEFRQQLERIGFKLDPREI